MTVALTKPVSLVKRPNRPSNRTAPSVYPPRAYVGEVSRANCQCASNEISECPKHDARAYALFSAKHR